MGLRDLLRRAKERVVLAEDAASEEERLQEEIERARTKAALEQAEQELKAARLKRRAEELRAQALLEKARTELNAQKAAKHRASAKKWEARWTKVGAALSGVAATARGTGKAVSAGASSLGISGPEFDVWDTTPAKVAARKAVSKKTSTRKRKAATASPASVGTYTGYPPYAHGGPYYGPPEEPTSAPKPKRKKAKAKTTTKTATKRKRSSDSDSWLAGIL